MLARWFLHGVSILVLVFMTVVGVLWWNHQQPTTINPLKAEQQSITLANGLRLHLQADPDAPHAEMVVDWTAGYVSEPTDLPGVHDLLLEALLHIESAAGHRHLANHLARDPLGDLTVTPQASHTRIRLQASPSVFLAEVQRMARLLHSPELPFPVIVNARYQLPDQSPAYGFLRPTEQRLLDDYVLDRFLAPGPVARSLDGWEGISDEGVARLVAQRASEKLSANLFDITLRAPLAMADLRAALPEFEELRAGTALPDAEQYAFSPMQEQLREPQIVRARELDLAPQMLLLYPWRLATEQRAEANELVRWAEAHYAGGLAERLVSNGLITHIEAHYNDEYFALHLTPTADGRANEAIIYSTASRFLAQLQNGPNANELIRRMAGDGRIAGELALTELNLDPSLFVLLESGPGAGNYNWRVEPVMQGYAQRALTLSLPQVRPSYPVADIPFIPNTFELLGWQPELLLDSEALTVWHYADNQFDTALANMTVRVHLPIGHHPEVQAQWQQWAEQTPAWWTATAQWSQHGQPDSGRGLRVAVDEQGIVWSFTDTWSVVEAWAIEWRSTLDRIAPEPAEPAEAKVVAHRLMQARAELTPLQVPESLAEYPLTVLLSGRVDRARASGLVTPWRETDVVASPAEVAAPEPLPTRHQVAEVEVPGDASRVVRILQIPQNDVRSTVLAEWALPWLQETLEGIARRQQFTGTVQVQLVRPTGIPALQVELSSSEQDPAMLGLYLNTIWAELRNAVAQFPVAVFQQSTQQRAALYRAPAESITLANQYFWQDISEQRAHFNGRLERSLILEGTSIEGWQYFMRQWLLEGVARQFTVYEIGAQWQEDYDRNRRLPAGSSLW